MSFRRFLHTPSAKKKKKMLVILGIASFAIAAHTRGRKRSGSHCGFSSLARWTRHCVGICKILFVVLARAKILFVFLPLREIFIS